MPFDFHFLRPLWLLLLIPLALLLWRLLRSAGEGDAWRGVVDAHLLPRLLSRDDTASQRLPLILLAIGWLVLVLALAGPTWQRLPQPLFQAQQFRVIALDLSPSMYAGDLRPSRLAHARYEVLDLLRRAGEGQTALIAYGAEPYIVSPLTNDSATIAAQVPLLDTGLLPVMGARRTDLALELAGDLLRQAEVPDGEVILVTDGVEHPAAATEAARKLSAAGFRVSLLGIGTEKGAPIALPGGGFAKDQDGNMILPRLDEDALAALASAGGGRYVTARLDDRDIITLMPAGAGRIRGDAEQQDTSSDQWREEGPWLLLLLLPLAAFAFRRGWLSPLLLMVFVLPAPEAHALDWQGLWLRPDQQAQRQLEAGEAGAAAEMFERPDWRAAAQYEAGDYAQALQTLEGRQDQATAYNRGNTLAHLGRLEDAVAAYDQALGIDPADDDARFNRDLVQGLLDRQLGERHRPPTADEGPPARDQQQAQDESQAEDQQGSDEQQPSEDQQASDEQQPSDDQQQAQQSDQGESSESESSQGESAEQGSPGEQGEQDETAEQGGESSGGEQNASQQAADETGQGEPQPGEEEQGGASSGTETADSGAEGGSQDQAGQTADASEQQDQQDAAGDREGEDREGATGGEQAQERQDPEGEPQDASREEGERPGDEETAGEPQPTEGEDLAEAGEKGERGEEQQAAQAGQAEQGQDGPDDTTGEDTETADAAGQRPEGEDAGAGPGGQPQTAADEGAGEDSGAEPDTGEGGAETATADATEAAGPDQDQGAGGPEQGPETAAPGSVSPEGPAEQPGLADLMGEERPRPPPRGPRLQTADGSSEDLQALEQMLRRVEDDPGGLLRQRFLLQHLRRSGRLP